jgi:hypothetical protein
MGFGSSPVVVWSLQLYSKSPTLSAARSPHFGEGIVYVIEFSGPDEKSIENSLETASAGHPSFDG